MYIYSATHDERCRILRGSVGQQGRRPARTHARARSDVSFFLSRALWRQYPFATSATPSRRASITLFIILLRTVRKPRARGSSTSDPSLSEPARGFSVQLY
jgi:hypothetical protein